MTSCLAEFDPPRAVVDWIELEIRLVKRSNGGSIHRWSRDFGASYAKPIDVGPGGAGSTFRVLVQNPECIGQLREMVANLEKQILRNQPDSGIIRPIAVSAIEISADFKPKCPDLAKTHDMTKRLMLSVRPPIIKNPRWVNTIGKIRQSDDLFPKAPLVDPTHTLYIGNKRDDLMWRTYTKVTDETYLENGTRKAKGLLPDEYRARVEVRTQGAELTLLGIKVLDDLDGFRFEKLNSVNWFHFKKRPEIKSIYAIAAAKAVQLHETPAYRLDECDLNDIRGRSRKQRKMLRTDTELTEATRNALRRLSARFGRANYAARRVVAAK